MSRQERSITFTDEQMGVIGDAGARGRGGAVNEDGDRLVWIVLAAVVVALVGLWATGALAAVALGGGWDPLPASEVPATATRLLSHLGDPAAAWPAGRRRAMPGAVAFWFCALLVAAAMALLAVGALRAAARLGIEWPGAGAARRAPTSRWARAADLRPLRVRGPQPSRMTLGRHGRSLLAADERQSVIVVAPTQSHKTTGPAIPALFEWRLRDAGRPLARRRRTCSAAGLQDADFWFAAAEKLLSPPRPKV